MKNLFTAAKDNTKGEFIILVNSRVHVGQKIALVDRTKFKSQWWTETIKKAMVFTGKDAADKRCKAISYGNPMIVTKVEGAAILNKQRSMAGQKRKSDWFGRALDRKMQEWHDDDWYEGIND